MNNHYVFDYDDNQYIIGFYAVADGEEYDYVGQLANYVDITEGWYKYSDNQLIVDEVRKAEIIAERQRESTWEERMEAQITYTAMMTDTLIEEDL